MHKCLHDIKTWMTVNKLNLNDKTKVMRIPLVESLGLSLPPSHLSLPPSHLSLPPSHLSLPPSHTLWLQVVHLFDCLTLSKSLIVTWPWKRTSQVCYAQLMLNSVALVPSVIFCSQMPQQFLCLSFFSHALSTAILSGLAAVSHKQLQKGKNNAAHLVPRVPKTHHISPHLTSLHYIAIYLLIHENSTN